MPVIPIGRRPAAPVISPGAFSAEDAPVAQVEDSRFKMQIMDLLDLRTRPPTDADRKRIERAVRAHLRRFAELLVTNAQEAQQRRELQIALNTMGDRLRRAQADILALEAGANRAQYLARHDSLTGLPNRGYFYECLATRLALPRKAGELVAVLYLDLDGFKGINDTYGHAVGDAVLRIVGARLRRILRADDGVGRLGGDEFACIVSGFRSRQSVRHLAQKIIETVAAPERINSLDLRVRISVGVAFASDYESHAESLLNTADAAMYEAKKRSTGCVLYDEAGTTGAK